MSLLAIQNEEALAEYRAACERARMAQRTVEVKRAELQLAMDEHLAAMRECAEREMQLQEIAA